MNATDLMNTTDFAPRSEDMMQKRVKAPGRLRKRQPEVKFPDPETGLFAT
jgi:hypothetical protein